MISTIFYLSKKRKNKKGLAPIYCRLSTSHTNRYDFSTGLFTEPDNWDSKKSFPKLNNDEVMVRLSGIQKRVYQAISDAETKQSIDFRAMAQKVIANQATVIPSLSELAKEYIQVTRPSNRAIAKINLTVNHWQDHANTNNIGKIYSETLTGFERSMKEKDYHNNTTSRHIQTVKRLLKYAVNKGYIRHNPFDDYKIPQIKYGIITTITPEEIKAIAEVETDLNSIAYARDLFLFQCYTGISYSDLWVYGTHLFTTNDSIKYLHGKRAKTGEEYITPFYPTAQAISEKYGHRFRRISNQKYNEYLKQIAPLAEIDTKLTTHVGRKTFAQHRIDEGYSFEAVSKMLGHSNFIMTKKHYAKASGKLVYMEVTAKTKAA